VKVTIGENVMVAAYRQQMEVNPVLPRVFKMAWQLRAARGILSGNHIAHMGK